MAQRIGAILPEIMRHTAGQHEALGRVQRRWPRLVGRTLAAHSKPVSLRRGRLVVHADRPGETFALSYRKASLLKRLAAESGGRIAELVIRPGEL
jgi:predicted nucleic acid-binding Zn ribbon protein